MESVFCSDCSFEWEGAVGLEPDFEESWEMDQYQEAEWDLWIIIEIKFEIEEWRDRYWRCMLYSRLIISFDSLINKFITSDVGVKK